MRSLPFRVFSAVDEAAHLLHARGLIPARVATWVCDRFEDYVNPGWR